MPSAEAWTECSDVQRFRVDPSDWPALVTWRHFLADRELGSRQHGLYVVSSLYVECG